jgi:hypothetical protein
MFRRALLFLSALLAAAPLPALAAGGNAYSASPIVFNGLIVQNGQTKVSLHNPNTGDTKWVQVGKKFGSYTVGFQLGVPGQTADAVILTLGTSSQRITLQGAASNLSTNTPVVATSIEPSPAVIAKRAALTSLNELLARVGNDPKTDPRLILALQTAIQQQQQSLTTGTAGRSFEKSSDDLNAPDAYTSELAYPDDSKTFIRYDANGTVTNISNNSAPDANRTIRVRSLYIAPDPDDPTTSPAVAK